MKSSRSGNGCWTCRVRRKKCDEAPTHCKTCARLGLSCSGYGDRPSWLDGGIKEHEYRMELKAAIKRGPLPRLTSTGSSALDVRRESVSSDPQIALQQERDEIISNLPTTNITLEDFSMSSEMIEFGDGMKCSGGMSEVFLHMDLSEDIRRKDSLSSTTTWLATPPSDLVMDGEKVPYDSTCDQATLLMHYLDYVYPLQFPFQTQPVCRQDRSWVLAFFRDSKTFYWLVLGLSAYHRLVHHDLEQGSLPQKPPGDDGQVSYYSTMALQEFNKDLERLRIAHDIGLTGRLRLNIEMLACVLQFMFLEFLGARSEAGIVGHHFLAADEILHVIADITTALRNRSSSSSSVDTEDIDEAHTAQDVESNLSEQYQNALSFLIGGVVWFDTLSSATRRTKNMITNEITSAFASYDIHLERYFGCENWVVHSIRSITALDAWRADHLQQNRLNMMDLVLRAEPIKQSLLDGLSAALVEDAELPNSTTERPAIGVSTNQAAAFRSTVRTITQIFASAALTYLHVVVSGPLPRVKDIEENVLRTVELCEKLTHYPELLRSTIWPLCVTGCMAADDVARNSFRKLLRDLEQGSYQPFGHDYNRALSVMEQCWTSRDAQIDCYWDWACAMSLLGTSIEPLVLR